MRKVLVARPRRVKRRRFGSADHPPMLAARAHQPGCAVARPAHGSRCGFLSVEQAEAGRARAGHAGEPAAGQGGDGADHVLDRRSDAYGRRLEVVALAGEPREQRFALLRHRAGGFGRAVFAGREAQCLENRRGRHGDAGMDDDDAEPG